MTILNFSILTFLVGLGLFSYGIYERSLILSLEEQRPKTEQLINGIDAKKLEVSKNDKSLLKIKNSLQSEILTKKLEIKEQKYQKNQLDEEISSLDLRKQDLESDLFDLKLEISKKKMSFLKDQKINKQQNSIIENKKEDPLSEKN